MMCLNVLGGMHLRLPIILNEGYGGRVLRIVFQNAKNIFNNTRRP